MDYELEIRDSFSDPLSDEKADKERLGHDAANHISEVGFVSGPSTVEYGGESPWTHVWRGTIRPEEVHPLYLDDNPTFEDRVEYIVDNLITYFDSGCTPHNTGVEDFEWKAVVVEADIPVLASDSYSLCIVWEPKE